MRVFVHVDVLTFSVECCVVLVPEGLYLHISDIHTGAIRQLYSSFVTAIVVVAYIGVELIQTILGSVTDAD